MNQSSARNNIVGPAAVSGAAEPVWVFESNLAGTHERGPALLALKAFGASAGKGSGQVGNSYAIPTHSGEMAPLTREIVANYVREFLKYAAAHPNMQFRVTAMGGGNSQLSQGDIAGMFKSAPGNCLLPGRWLELLGRLNVARVIVLDRATLLGGAEGQRCLDDYLALNSALWAAERIEIVSIGPAKSVVANDQYARRRGHGHRIISANEQYYAGDVALARDEIAVWYATRLLTLTASQQTAPPHLFRVIQAAVRAGLPVEELLVSE
ncbi:MAG: A1S_2505 family phage non-structural protein [Chromatiales bacterium]